MIGVGQDGELNVRWGSATIVEWDRIGTDALEALTSSLHRVEGVKERASSDEILREVVAAVATVVDGRATAQTELARLEADLAVGLGATVVVAAVGAVAWFGAPRLVADEVVIGQISEAFEDAVTALGQSHGINRRFRFDVDTRWPEDMASMREDPDIAPDLDAWLPTLVAVAVDAVGGTGAYIAHQMVESILGAVWLATQAGDNWVHLPPWIIGESVGDDEAAARAEEHEIGVFMYQHSDRKPPYGERVIAGWDYHLEDLLDQPVGRLVRVVAGSLPFGRASAGPASRLASACRHAVLGARLLDPAQAILHFTTAVEALVNSGKNDVTANFKRRVSKLIAPAGGTETARLKRLGEIYDERSRIVHSGFTTSTPEIVGTRAAEVRTYLTLAALQIAFLVEAGTTTDAELMKWLDS